MPLKGKRFRPPEKQTQRPSSRKAQKALTEQQIADHKKNGTLVKEYDQGGRQLRGYNTRWKKGQSGNPSGKNGSNTARKAKEVIITKEELLKMTTNEKLAVVKHNQNDRTDGVGIVVKESNPMPTDERIFNGAPLKIDFSLAENREKYLGWHQNLNPREALKDLLQFDDASLRAIADDDNVSVFVRRCARIIATGHWSELSGVLNQAFGAPVAKVETTTKVETTIKPNELLSQAINAVEAELIDGIND